MKDLSYTKINLSNFTQHELSVIYKEYARISGTELRANFCDGSNAMIFNYGGSTRRSHYDADEFNLTELTEVKPILFEDWKVINSRDDIKVNQIIHHGDRFFTVKYVGLSLVVVVEAGAPKGVDLARSIDSLIGDKIQFLSCRFEPVINYEERAIKLVEAIKKIAPMSLLNFDWLDLGEEERKEWIELAKNKKIYKSILKHIKKNKAEV